MVNTNWRSYGNSHSVYNHYGTAMQNHDDYNTNWDFDDDDPQAEYLRAQQFDEAAKWVYELYFDDRFTDEEKDKLYEVNELLQQTAEEYYSV